MEKKLIFFTLVVEITLQACSSNGKNEKILPAETSQKRVYVNEKFDTLFEVKSMANDTLFARLLYSAAGDNRVYAVDVVKKTIFAFNDSGTPVWTYGKKGGGPEEFMNIVDIEVDKNGNVWASDGNLSKVVVLDRNGVRKHSIPTTIVPRHIAPFGTEVFSTVNSEDVLFARVDSSGKKMDYPVPPSRLRKLNPLDYQMSTAIDANNGYMVLASPFVSEFFVYGKSGKSLVCAGNQVEMPAETPVTIPPSTRPRGYMFYLTASNGLIYLLGRGDESRNKVREIVDVYNLYDCKYLRSFKLPRQVTSITSRGSEFFVTYDDSTEGPGVLALKRIP